jgi:ATP-dependent exoDNAse (exonuclease V) beta subunit
VYYLIENYRSTAHIIAAANCLIAHNTDRMKTGSPIRVNKARQNLPPGATGNSTIRLLKEKCKSSRYGTL